MKILDNITNTVRDDLRVEIKKGSRVSIAAACFSMYAYKELKKQLETIDEFEFIFTSPTFVKEKAEKQKREFYIPRISRETSLYGTEFEIKLRNEMTQRAIAKECADWIRRKATFKSNTTGENMAGFMTVDSGAAQTAYMPIGGFTTVDIGCERGNNSYNMVNCMEAPFAQQYMKLFDSLWNDRDKMQDVTDVVLENISTAYAENSPEFIYFMTLYHVFSEFLDDISEDELPNEATGFKQSKIWSLLYDFQKDAVLAIINKLEKYNGCILADSVGLGKTFTALAVVKYYENRNKSVLVLCPKKLAENWNTYKDNYVNNPIASDRLNYDVLFHTDLSRSSGKSNDSAKRELVALFGGIAVFETPKPVSLIAHFIRVCNDSENGIFLDFFSGTGSTAHAVIKLNAEDGGHRKFIMVQLPEKTDEKSEAYKAGYKNICEIGKERIRRAGRKIKEDAGLTAPADLDIGFRCLRLDSSNMENVYYTPEETQQQDLFSLVDNVKPDRTPEDLLFQVMLDLGVLLSSPIEVKEIAGKKVFNVAEGFLLACFDHDVTEETVKAIAQMKPYYAVFRDSSMANDSVATNFDQIFETYSPETVRKVL